MRTEFPAKVRLAALRRAAYKCECYLLAGFLPEFTSVACGVAIGPGNSFFEHVIPDDMGGAPTLDNCAVLCRTCWRLKTSLYDAPKLAKVRHQTKGIYGIKKRRGPPMPGSRASKWKRGFDGKATRR